MKCVRCAHLDHGSEWCDETVITGSSTQEMCGCSPGMSIMHDCGYALGAHGHDGGRLVCPTETEARERWGR